MNRCASSILIVVSGITMIIQKNNLNCLSVRLQLVIFGSYPFIREPYRPASWIHNSFSISLSLIMYLSPSLLYYTFLLLLLLPSPENMSFIFSCSSEAEASELQENMKDMFSLLLPLFHISLPLGVSTHAHFFALLSRQHRFLRSLHFLLRHF